MKRFALILLNLVIVGGLVLAVWPLGQTAYGVWNQRVLHQQWQREAKREHNTATAAQAAAGRAVTIQASRNRTGGASGATTSKGWPATRLIMPDLDLDTVVLDGWDDATLRRAPGHRPSSSKPGQPGNCVIAAHRNIYGSFFRRIDEVAPGSLIQLRTPDATYNYRTALIYNVAETDTSVLQAPLDPREGPRLTLVTCTLPHSDDRMIIVAFLEAVTR